jgi:iron complex transport system substrate-binding protein
LCSCSGGEDRTVDPETLRIISLSPAVTLTLIKIGLTEQIVAVGDLDPAKPEGVPSVGMNIDLDLERIVALQPTHILGTPGLEGMPSSLDQINAGDSFEVHALVYPDRLSDISDLIRETAEAVGLPDHGIELSEELNRELEDIAALPRFDPAPRVLMAFAVSPVMASGPRTVNDELLVLAGGTNVAKDAKVSAPLFDREKLMALSPEVILLMRPGGNADGEGKALGELKTLDIAAVQDGQVHVLRDPLVLLPGPNVAETARQMRVALEQYAASLNTSGIDIANLTLAGVAE